ncbi:unnamed protein product [Amoebophrya sp. A25]|nr:unnamed protein product [Amoebophrya sp. A25]|eukprot:GSA25T00015442001.1
MSLLLHAQHTTSTAIRTSFLDDGTSNFNFQKHEDPSIYERLAKIPVARRDIGTAMQPRIFCNGEGVPRFGIRLEDVEVEAEADASGNVNSYSTAGVNNINQEWRLVDLLQGTPSTTGDDPVPNYLHLPDYPLDHSEDHVLSFAGFRPGTGFSRAHSGRKIEVVGLEPAAGGEEGGSYAKRTTEVKLLKKMDDVAVPQARVASNSSTTSAGQKKKPAPSSKSKWMMKMAEKIKTTKKGNELAGPAAKYASSARLDLEGSSTSMLSSPSTASSFKEKGKAKVEQPPSKEQPKAKGTQPSHPGTNQSTGQKLKNLMIRPKQVESETTHFVKSYDQTFDPSKVRPLVIKVEGESPGFWSRYTESNCKIGDGRGADDDDDSGSSGAGGGQLQEDDSQELAQGAKSKSTILNHHVNKAYPFRCYNVTTLSPAAENAKHFLF